MAVERPAIHRLIEAQSRRVEYVGKFAFIISSSFGWSSGLLRGVGIMHVLESNIRLSLVKYNLISHISCCRCDAPYFRQLEPVLILLSSL
jgi:hypothetical protein